jgi:DNA-binding transcriptional ArsR family regulator
VSFLSVKKGRPSGDSIESTRLYHELYLRAVSNPLRRKILRALKEGSATIEELSYKTGIESEALKWHLDTLEHGFCVEKENVDGRWLYKITQEGRVVDYLK